SSQTSGRAPSPFPSRSPLDGKPLAPVAGTSPADVSSLVARARRAQVAWAERPASARASALAPLKRRILARAEAIAELVRAECGKPLEEAALAEVLPNADLVEYWTRSIEELVEPATLDLDPLAYPGKRGRVYREPRGVVALITPWNYPVAI